MERNRHIYVFSAAQITPTTSVYAGSEQINRGAAPEGHRGEAAFLEVGVSEQLNSGTGFPQITDRRSKTAREPRSLAQREHSQFRCAPADGEARHAPDISEIWSAAGCPASPKPKRKS